MHNIGGIDSVDDGESNASELRDLTVGFTFQIDTEQITIKYNPKN